MYCVIRGAFFVDARTLRGITKTDIRQHIVRYELVL